MSDSSALVTAKMDNIAVASLVLGIASLVIGIVTMPWFPVGLLVSLLLGGAAMALGLFSLRRIRRSGEKLRGMWMAIAGLVLGENAILFLFLLPAAL